MSYIKLGNDFAFHFVTLGNILIEQPS